MKVVLLRHAMRDLSGHPNPSLNANGRQQAQGLVRRLAPQGSYPTPTLLISSPKKRARETLQPLSENLALKLLIEPNLDERKEGESEAQFTARIRDFVGQLPTRIGAKDTVYLCSHLDWLQICLQVISSDIPEIESELGFACCELRIFRIDGGIWRSLKVNREP